MYATYHVGDVSMARHGDKRQVTTLLAYFAIWNMLPIQVIFQEEMAKCLPEGKEAHYLRMYG